MQLDMFSARRGPAAACADPPLSPGLKARPYQEEAFSGVEKQLADNRSTLLVLPTGSGKTFIFSRIAHNWPSRPYARELSERVLVLAHRDELLQQARQRIAKETGELVGLEQAEARAGLERIVVGSVQTMCQPDRLHSWNPDTFGLVICDEAHHGCSPSYRRIFEHFSQAKLLGVTATPDRADEKAMGQVFESVAFVYEIEDAINDAWLVPIRVRQVFIDAIKLASCRTTAGDLNQGDLDAAMAVEEALHGVVNATIEQAGNRKTIVYTTSVDNAARLAEIFNRYQPGSARDVNGKTPIDVRRQMLAGFERGDFQRLVNCGIATEGFDCPPVSCIAQARPTKSRSLHAQIVGRGLRPVYAPGFDLDTVEGRRQAIAAGKSECLILEFTGNSGKHRLASSVDILGGRYDEDEVERAKKIVEAKPGMRADEALAQAHAEAEKRRADEAAKRARLKATVKYATRDFSPFDVLHLGSDKHDSWDHRFGGAVATEKQLHALDKFGVDVPKDCTKAQAKRLLDACFARADQGLARYKQVKLIERYGIQAINMSMSRASEMIDAIKSAGWKRPSADVVDRILGRERSASEDG